MNAAPRFTPTSDLEGVWPADLTAGLSLLLQAYEYALQVESDPWQFAVEITCLRSVGLTHSALRWLLGKGYAEHAVEAAAADTDRRLFHPVGSLALPDGACFLLTDRGVDLARAVLRADTPHRVALSHLHPHWDQQRRELRCGELLVKAYRRPAPNQELVLAAFEEEGWPPQIDDPLPGSYELDTKQRLHDTIVRLNRNQKHRLLVFRGDGSGKGLCWALRATTNPADAPHPHQIDSGESLQG
jgi:hypothetical protein